MTETRYLETATILATLREIAGAVRSPLWLFGGVAVDFLVGRWTRPHGDIDLNAFAEDRDAIARDLARIAYVSPDTGWLTHWRQAATGHAVELVFLERATDGEAIVVIREGDPIGTPGRYPTVRGYLDPTRWAELDGLRFRVSHPLGEWRARRQGSGVIAGRAPDPKLEHDRRLLETIIPESERLS